MNFSLVLFVLVLITGSFYALDVLVLKPKRRLAAAQAIQHASSSAILSPDVERGIRQQHMRQPMWLEYTASFFPVILFVFVLRSFVVEPFKIPSGSMIPTLLVGDLILVNKFSYGIRLPLIDKKIIPIANPKAGDVVVFRYPLDPKLDYIKRVVAVGGDVVEYRNKKLLLNGKPQTLNALEPFYDANSFRYSKQYREHIGPISHAILNDDDAPAYVIGTHDFVGKENCSYDVAGFRCMVPEGKYFVMGDNRDNSSDSRVWGFVEDRQLVGKAFMIWMNFNDFSRIGFFH